MVRVNSLLKTNALPRTFTRKLIHNECQNRPKRTRTRRLADESSFYWPPDSGFCSAVLPISKLLMCVCFVLFIFGATPPNGPRPSHSRCFYIIHNDATQSIRLLWTSDQLAAETSTCPHTTIITDRHSRYRWDSNPQAQQARGRSPTP
jgi:hypothetical protein